MLVNGKTLPLDFGARRNTARFDGGALAYVFGTSVSRTSLLIDIDRLIAYLRAFQLRKGMYLRSVNQEAVQNFLTGFKVALLRP